MTKALQLARAFHRAGHRVVLVESAKYRLTGHRFSRAVDRFHAVPGPGEPGYADGAADDRRAARRVDVYVPVCSPASALADAQAKAALAGHCEVLHSDPATLERLDDKDALRDAAAELGLTVPDAHRITAPDQVVRFDFDGRRAALHPQEHRLRPRPPPRPDAAAAPDAAATARVPRRPRRSPRRTRGSCRRSSPARSTAPTRPPATAACSCTAAVSPRPSSSTTRWSTCRRSRTGCGASSAPSG